MPQKPDATDVLFLLHSQNDTCKCAYDWSWRWNFNYTSLSSSLSFIWYGRKTRNLSEKKRRDQFNMLINELCSMVAANNKKMDKSTVLKSAIQFLKTHQGIAHLLLWLFCRYHIFQCLSPTPRLPIPLPP